MKIEQKNELSSKAKIREEIEKNSINYNLKELRKKITTYLKYYRNAEILNIDANYLIMFNSTSFRKLVSKSGKIKLIALLQIEDSIKTAKFISSEIDKKGRKEIISVHKFNNRVEVNNKIYACTFSVRELRDGEYYIYSFHIKVGTKKI